MNKNVLNEINQMRFMFGYKMGKVLSEQEERPFTEPEDPKHELGSGPTPGPKGEVGTALAIYVVQPGDTLTKVAEMMDVSVEDIMKSNPQIKDKNKIYPGDKIQIEK